MAEKLTGEELARTLTDFDPPLKEINARNCDFFPIGQAAQPPAKEAPRKRRGNPNGRPPSLNPHNHKVTFKLTADEAARLNEAARLMGTTKTRIIVDGIDAAYRKAKLEERRRAKQQGTGEESQPPAGDPPAGNGEIIPR